MPEVLNDLLARYGYAFIALLVFIESVGVPIPGDTAVVTAAALSARGTLSIAGVVIAASVGAISGGMAGYWIGLRTGTSIVLRHGRWLRLDAKKLARAQRYFDRYGAATIFFGRFVAFLRTLAVILAGMARMPFIRFALFNAAASIVWSCVLGALGYLFGRNLPRLIGNLGRASLLAALFLALSVTIVASWRWFYRNGALALSALSRRWNAWARSPRLAALRERHPALWRYLVRRFARGEYLAMHLVVGFVASLAVLALFGAITEDVAENAPLTPFDVGVAGRLRGTVPEQWLSALGVVSYLGSPVVMAALLAAVALALAVHRRWLTLGGWLAAFIGAALLDVTLKLIVRRVGAPLGGGVFLHGQTLSFPSGHALGALVGYGMLAHVLATTIGRRAGQVAVVLAAALTVTLVAVSRLYLGIHFFSDTMAGLAAGLTWLTACITGLELARRHHGPPLGSARSLAA